MKKRSGFVSNSSSSSFVLAVRRGYPVEDFDCGDLYGVKGTLLPFLQQRAFTSVEQIVHDRLCDELGNDYAAEMITDSLLQEDVQEITERTIAQLLDAIGPDESPDDWKFHMGDASYNETWDDGERMIGNGLAIKSKNVRLV